MPGKSKKSVIKRFTITKNRRLSHRLPNQNRNAGQTGDEERRKRGRKTVGGLIKRQLLKLSKTS